MTKQQIIYKIQDTLDSAMRCYEANLKYDAREKFQHAEYLYSCKLRKFKKIELFKTYLNIAINNKFNPNCQLALVEKTKEVEHWFLHE